MLIYVILILLENDIVEVIVIDDDWEKSEEWMFWVCCGGIDKLLYIIVYDKWCYFGYFV